MTYSLPKIDQRSQQELTDEIRSLLLKNCPELTSIDDIKSDQQIDALVHIFSNMMGYVVNALNQAPEKNFTAFLNLIGVSPTPPRVAEAPVVFKLKEDWDKDGYIPAGTKISAQPENQEEVIFETENDLTVIRPEPVKAVTIDPKDDKWSNQDFLFSKEATGEEAVLFQGKDQILHRLYISHEKLLSYKEATVKLNITLNKKAINDIPSDENETPKNVFKVQWYYFDKKGIPQPLEVLPEFDEQGNPKPSYIEDLKESNFLVDGNSSFTFSKITEFTPKTLSGYDNSHNLKEWSGRWIYAELKSSLKEDNLPVIQDVKLGLVIKSEVLKAEQALFNLSPIDLTKDFYPFGERGVFNDTFYIACKDAFSQENAVITMNINLSDKNACKLPEPEHVKLGWEYWDGSKWSGFGTSTANTAIILTTPLDTSDPVFEDTTEAFTKGGENVCVKFTCPAIKACELNGQENYWIRVRIIEGDYSIPDIASQGTNGSDTTNKTAYSLPTYQPPSIKNLSISYTYSSQDETPDTVICENNFVMVDRTEDCKTSGNTFNVFSACEDVNQTFYMAFDRDISNLPLSLYFPLSGDQMGTVGDDPVVAWEYWNGNKWLTLSVNDAIRDFTRSEIQQINIPSDIEKRPLFGVENYWIRARLETGGFDYYPTLNSIYSNAVWVSNTNTIQGEILGSSNGEPSQAFQFIRTPVLSGQVIKVHETLGEGEWVEWEEVQTFSLSDSDSRHYMLDSQTGILTFGDGKNGMIPPAGNDNIMCDYKYGGGTVGNVQASSIKKLWTSFTEIDSASNPVAADGGFDQEEAEEAKARGPHTLKSLNRGVTCEDIEWLVREAAPQIAIVKCFPTMDRNLDYVAGKATVIVVPEYDNPKPVPSQELLSEIDEYLSERISAVLKASSTPRLDIIGPDYIRVGVEADVVYATKGNGKIIEGQIIDNLKEFLNPLHGGQDKTGWKLGKNLYISEVCSVIKNTAGVDYIKDISVNASVQCYTLNLEPLKDGYYKPDITYPVHSAVKSSDNRIVFELARKLEPQKAVKALMIRGFREKQKITLKHRKCKEVVLDIISVNGDILECRTSEGLPLEYDYPVGSDVVAKISDDRIVRSYILNQITGNPESFFIKVAVPEARDVVYLSRDDEYVNTTPLKIREVRSGDIFLEEDEMVYSGIHLINKKHYLKFPYLKNLDTGIIHDLSNTVPQCRIGEIVKEDRQYLESNAVIAAKNKCKCCFLPE